MLTLVVLLQSLAVLALAGAGFAVVVGWRSLRDRLLRISAGAFFTSIALPYLVHDLAKTANTISCTMPEGGVGLPTGLAVPVILGHVVLVFVVLRRRLRDPNRASREAQETERVRGRERTRLPPGAP